MAEAEAKKREVPQSLKVLLNYDINISNKFATWANKFAPLRSLRVHYQVLEVSCHGIPWFAFWIAFTWLFNKPNLIPLQVNILFGLIIDIILVAVAKAYFRRKRPASNKDDALGQMGPDIFSFPSGHTSRAIFVLIFFTCLYPLPKIFYPSLLAWATAVSLSRILMMRHYILDVLGGIILGIFEGIIMYILWIDDETARWLIGSISDEKLDGGDYHV